ncbi:MAG: tRNA (adenosine(37)-N6)-threonylcarbamoyltransferase complex ATPase subunit type 1 TsaE [Candidatus Nanopelagicales bacterium]
MERSFEVATPAAMEALGRSIGRSLRSGDLVVLDGELGAGKTTLVRGIGVGLGVRGPISSPTFVIARVHPSLVAGPALVHVDAYRLPSIGDVDELDLDESIDSSVTVVEWGAGKAEQLAECALTIRIERTVGEVVAADQDVRHVSITSQTSGWAARLAELAT